MRLSPVLLTATLLLAGCSWFQEKEVPLEGKRISVMSHARTLTPESQSEAVVLPPARRNADWPQAGGLPSHNVQHLVAGVPTSDGGLRVDAGAGVRSWKPLIAPPIAAGGRVFTADTDHRVHAFDLATGNRVWSTHVAKGVSDDDALVGGLAFDQGRVFVATGFGDLVALDAAGGQELWRHSLGAPMHGPPTVDSGRIFVISIDNVLHARNVADGSEAWAPRRALPEPAAILGTANPAAGGGFIFAPFSSGEVIALRADNGRPVWSTTLGTTRRTDELSLLSDVRARPILDGQTIYAMSYGGTLAAIDARSGQVRWEREIGGLNTPWLAGRYLFVVDNDNQLMCVNAESGSIVWVVQLPVFQDEKNREDPIIWNGPTLVSDRLILLGSHGAMQVRSPYTGEIVSQGRLRAGVSVSPAIADGTLIILDDDGWLTLFR
jgi:outer membrane protein assembly factor BamB